MPHWPLLLLPLLPMIGRTALAIVFRRQYMEQLSEKQLDRDAHRSIEMTLVGFSFLALTTLVSLPSSASSVAIYYVAVSLFGLVCSVNLQSYKQRRWHDQLATTLREIGYLALLLAVAALLLDHTPLKRTLAKSLAAAGVAIWTIDHGIRIHLRWSYLSGLQRVRNDE